MSGDTTPLDSEAFHQEIVELVSNNREVVELARESNVNSQSVHNTVADSISKCNDPSAE